MSLDPLHWKKLARVSYYGSYGWQMYLEAIYLRLAAANDAYYDEEPGVTGTRVAGTDSAVVAGIDRFDYAPGGADYDPSYPYFDGVAEAVHWKYAGTTPRSLINPAGMVCAMDSANPNPKSATMSTPDAFVKNEMYMTCCKNASGAYSHGSWPDANPFGSGENFGAWRMWGGNFDIYECEEAVGIACSGQYGGLTGALWDPQSTHPGDMETDGRRYGMISTRRGGGSNPYFHSHNWMWSGSSQALLTHHTTDAYNHIGMFYPGSSSKDYIRRATIKFAAPQATGTQITDNDNMFTTVSGRAIILTGIPFIRSGDYFFCGSSREFGIAKGLPAGAVFQSGGVDVGYAGWNPGGGMVSTYGTSLALKA